jgi:hypothetical protein
MIIDYGSRSSTQTVFLSPPRGERYFLVEWRIFCGGIIPFWRLEGNDQRRT